jgi:peptidylprolyl isomerase
MPFFCEHRQRNNTVTQAKQGDTVKVHYTGTLNDGTVFDSSQGRDPLQFTIGEQNVIPGFEQAVIGLGIGETVKTEIPANQAYGARDERLVAQIPRDRIPQDMQLTVDDRLQVRRPDGGMAVMTVTAMSESNVTLDGNHPLAGMDLTFDIELVEIG